jgi:hypothetical protein
VITCLEGPLRTKGTAEEEIRLYYCYNASRRALESQRTKGTAEEEIRLYYV